MKEEIKDILELLRDGVKRPVVTLSKYSLDNICELNPNECKKLLEYIENLQSQLKEKEEELKYTIGIVEHNKIVSEKNKQIKQLKEVIKETREQLEKELELSKKRLYIKKICKKIYL